jgi:peptidoglycan/xylan/chitin deacetylase (PgdA/CDA1 family)/spore germination protein YaaH/GT2 family glycosyltransferase
MTNDVRAVFYDPEGRRARRANAALFLVVFVASIGLAVYAAGLIMAPRLPHVAIGIEKSAVTGANGPLPRALEGAKFLPVANRALPSEAAPIKRFAFFASGDPSSFISLKANGGEIDAILPDWISIAPSGKAINREYPTGEGAVRKLRRDQGLDLEIYPVLSATQSYAETAAILARAENRRLLAEDIGRYLAEGDYDGVAVALPELGPASHANLAHFLDDLGRSLHPSGRKIITVMSPRRPDTRDQELAHRSDLVLIKTYEGPIDARPAPLASQGWFESELAAVLQGIDAAKLIVGIGSFASDWDAIDRRRELAVQRAWELLDEAKAPLSFDVKTLNPHFRYTGADVLTHNVWFLDGVTVFNQARAAFAARPAGVALWRLGLEDPGAWASLGRDRFPDREALAHLERPPPGNDVYERFRSDVVDLLPSHANGERRLSYSDDLGLIVGQSLERAPKQDQLVSPGFAGDKLVALTFDDGPDEKYTGQILDILAERNAKATFFIIGRNAVRNPDLLKRIYAEGHDIGNHTYSHRDLLKSTTGDIELELNGTQRVIESQLGIHTILFRAPYASPNFKKELEAPRVIETADRLGYLTTTASVDAFDWTAATPAQIVERVAGGIERGRGQVVLMHDSGGNRRPTVAALPVILDRLSSQGFKFVALHDLIGKERGEVMPVIGGEQLALKAGLNIRLACMTTMAALEEGLPYVLVGAAGLGALRLLLVVAAAFVQRRRERRRSFPGGRPVTLSVLIPAFNEQKVISKPVASVLAASSEIDFDVIVVDDGSSDRTAEAVREAFAGNERVRVYRKANGGKSSALNFGLARTDAEVVLIIDADTVLAARAPELLARHFADPRIGAVAGNAIVGNPVNLITRFQALEYITGQNLDRRAFELANAIGVVPGAISAWRRRALIEAGGFPSDTLAEDADATIALERRGWRVIYEPAAAALTEAPETLRAFLKQRFRWVFGTLQVAHKHAGAVLRGEPLGVALITVPNVYIFQMGFALLAPLMDAALVLDLARLAAAGLNGSGDMADAHLGPVAQYWLLFQALDIAAAAAAIHINGVASGWRLLPLTLIQRFCYRQLLYMVVLRSFSAAIKGHFVGWGKLARTGSVSAAAGSRAYGSFGEHAVPPAVLPSLQRIHA